MYSVNLDSLQDYSQIPVQKPEQKSSASNGTKDFFSMLNENLNKVDEPKVAEKKEEVAKNDTLKSPDAKPAEKEKAADSPKEISKETAKPQEKLDKKEVASAKDDAAEKVSKKESRAEKNKGSKIAKGDEKGNAKTSVDEVLQGTVFAKNLGNEKAVSENAKDSKNAKNSEKKVSSAAKLKAANDSQQQEGFEKVAALKTEEMSPEDLRIGLAKKNFINEKMAAKNSEEVETDSDAEIISANGMLSAMQANSASVAASNKSFENVKNVNLAEMKNASSAKGKKDVKIEVKDLRTKVEAAAVNAKEVKKDFVKAVNSEAEAKVELTMDLGVRTEQNILSLDGQSAAADGSTFQAMLKNQITQNAGEFVRAGNIVLRDNNAGSINLVLHPEELGNVKIGLELDGKTVTGHIIVASREAFNAFGDGADILKNAFIQSGFEDAHFDVTYAGSEMQFAQNSGNQENGGNGNSHHGRKIYGEFVEENVSVVSQNSDKYNDMADYSVDIVA